MEGRKGHRALQSPFSHDGTAYYSCLVAVPQSPTYSTAVDYEAEAVVDDRTLTSGYLRCVDRQAVMLVLRYYSVPPQPSPLPCQPSIPTTLDLKKEKLWSARATEPRVGFFCCLSRKTNHNNKNLSDINIPTRSAN